MPRRLMVFLKHLGLSLSGLAVLFLLWEIAPGRRWVNPRYLPGFTQVVAAIGDMGGSGEFWPHLVVSLWRAAGGLLIAIALGLPLGLALGQKEGPVMAAAGPLLRFLSQANPFSLMPVFILFFGVGEIAKLAVVAWVCLWPILFNTITGVRTVDPALLKTARSLNVGPWRLIVNVVLPGAAPAIFGGIQIGIQMAFFMLIAAEMIGASVGLGYLLHLSAMVNQTVRVYAAGFAIALLGMALNRLLLFLKRSLFFWNETGEAAGAGSGRERVRMPARYAILIVAALMAGILFSGGLEAERVRHFQPMIHSHGGGYTD